ncbi:MAG: tRNA uridine-5-carboxymethylaminomethyl(34) synthesis GTPase MnmE [Calditrichaceae bacterium]
MIIEDQNDTIISLISSSTGGSVAILRISGNNAVSITEKFFPGYDLVKSSGGRFYVGNFLSSSHEVIDQVVLLIYKKPHSYTGEDVVEINCHANPFIIRKIIEEYLTANCRMAAPGEFSKRAFLNGKMDLVQAEAVADLINAKSNAIVKNSLLQLSGQLSGIIIKIKDDMIRIASLLELDLDFSEEDLNIITADQILEILNMAESKIDSLLKSYKVGHVLTKGIDVLIIGKPNVGKSSLMNAFLNKDRVIVSNVPGTTRDIIHEDIVINNTYVRFIDTAGIRITDDFIESEGVSRTTKFMKQADVIILLVDASEPLTSEDTHLISSMTAEYPQKLIVAANKTDKGTDQNCERYLNKVNVKTQYISAKLNKNIDVLKNSITEKIFLLEKEISEEVLITNERQYESLKKSRADLRSTKDGLMNGMGYEFIAVDIRTAIEHLSEITGEISTDDILNNIFSQFCIGK